MNLNPQNETAASGESGDGYFVARSTSEAPDARSTRTPKT
jgi:hypothetical protein